MMHAILGHAIDRSGFVEPEPGRAVAVTAIVEAVENLLVPLRLAGRGRRQAEDRPVSVLVAEFSALDRSTVKRAPFTEGQLLIRRAAIGGAADKAVDHRFLPGCMSGFGWR